VLVVVVTAAAAATVIAPAGAGEVTVTIAPSQAPAGTSMEITVSSAEACHSVVEAFSIADPRVTLSESNQLAWSAIAPALMPPLPAEVTSIPADGYRVFLGVGCMGADGKLASVACAEVRVLPAGAAPTGSSTAPFVAGPDLLNTDRELSDCEQQNAIPLVLIPGQIQSIIGFVNQTWLALLSPVAATTTTSTTLRVPVTTPTTPPTVATTPPTTPVT
jgi:hypothetical protein